MPLRADIVRKKLLQIDQSTARLRSWMPVSLKTFETDLQLQWAIERGLQVAAEAVFDAGNHVLAAEFHESVDEYREVPTRLAASNGLTRGSCPFDPFDLAPNRSRRVSEFGKTAKRAVDAFSCFVSGNGHTPKTSVARVLQNCYCFHNHERS